MARLARVESPSAGARRASRAELSGTDMSPIVYASGLGSNVTDVDGNRYVDFAAGFGSVLLGHGSPRIARAMEMQAQRLWIALGDLHCADAKVALVEKVAGLYPLPGARALLGQSGSDAVTAALKTSRLATGKPGVVAFEGGYHGLGYGPLAACGLKASFREPFLDQLNPHVRFVPYPAFPTDLDRVLSSIERAMAKGDVGAVLIEPILGRGGLIVPPDSFWSELAFVTRRWGALLVADEIWTGLGRSGAMLASVALGFVPDLVCLGKGLGGGLPLSACIGPDAIMQAWARKEDEEVVHTATFHGAPLACATGIATIDAVRSGKLDQRAAEVGARLRDALDRMLEQVGSSGREVGKTRGRGLMLGIALDGVASALAVHRELLAAGYLTTLGGTQTEVLILTPALTVSETLFDGFLGVLRRILEGKSAGGRAAS